MNYEQCEGEFSLLSLSLVTASAQKGCSRTCIRSSEISGKELKELPLVGK